MQTLGSSESTTAKAHHTGESNPLKPNTPSGIPLWSLFSPSSTIIAPYPLPFFSQSASSHHNLRPSVGSVTYSHAIPKGHLPQHKRLGPLRQNPDRLILPSRTMTREGHWEALLVEKKVGTAGHGMLLEWSRTTEISDNIKGAVFRIITEIYNDDPDKSAYTAYQGCGFHVGEGILYSVEHNASIPRNKESLELNQVR